MESLAFTRSLDKLSILFGHVCLPFLGCLVMASAVDCGDSGRIGSRIVVNDPRVVSIQGLCGTATM